MSMASPPAARARATSPSSSPRCTPAAPTARASATSSLTMNSAPPPSQTRESIAACLRRSDSLAVLLRYWMTCAPPAMAASTLATSSAMSTMSGVIA